MSDKNSIFSILKEGKKLISLLSNKFNNEYRVYTYEGKSENNILKIYLNKSLKLDDEYELKICRVKSNNPKTKITTNAVSIITENKKNEHLIYSCDSFMNIPGEIIYDTKTPLPNPIIFKSNSDFEIVFQLLDK